MNKMKFLLVCSAALAAGISFAGLVDFDKLNLNKEGEFATPDSNVMVTGAAYADNQYTLDGELTDLGLTVTPNVTTQAIEKFTLTFKVGFADSLPDYENAAIGFAFKAANTATYWNGSQWNDITLTTSVTEEGSAMMFADRIEAA